MRSKEARAERGACQPGQQLQPGPGQHYTAVRGGQMGGGEANGRILWPNWRRRLKCGRMCKMVSLIMVCLLFLSCKLHYNMLSFVRRWV